MGKLAFNSYAKINLYLAVLNKRRDNYHNIKTLFERISLCDRITLSARKDDLIKISCSHPGVPKDNSNLCFRSAELLRRKFNLKIGLDIRIIKRIPVAAGLGGGSSNAASVLWGINRMCGLHLSREKLALLAKKIGCDVPFFIYNTPFALGLERGDKIKPMEGLRNLRFWHILVAPRFKVSTPLIYAKWDEFNRRKSPCKYYGSGLKNKKAGLTPLDKSSILKKNYLTGLTIPAFDDKILTSAKSKECPSLAGRILFNSLEEAAAGIYPEINIIKEKLVSLGAKTILMSGSGPAVFGIVSSRKEALTLRKKINNFAQPWQVYVTKTF